MQLKRLSGWLIVPSFMAASLMAAGPSARLVDAVKNTDKASARALLEQHVDVNAPETDGTTALHWAARWDDLETAELLIRNGANVKAANRYNVTPLSLACVNGNAAMIALLLKAGADPNTALPEGETALMTASRTGKVEAVKLLIARGADPNAKEKGHGQTALMWAAAEGNTAVVEELLEHGADMHARSDGFTPLLFAVREGRIGTVRAMSKLGADVNETWQGPRRMSGSGSSALVLAVANAHYELALALLDAGADPNAAAQGWTALHQITWVHKPGTGTNDPAPEGSGNLQAFDFVRKLVAHGANVNARMTKSAKLGPTDLNMIGATPFLMAARTADAPLMRLLAELGADPLLPNADNTTPLAVAAGIGTHSPGEDAGTEPEVLEAVKVALELGGDINAVDNKGETVMHGVAYKQVPTVAQFLIDKGAKIEVWNRKDKEGVSPLRIADGAFVLSKLRAPSPGVAAVLRKALSDAGLSTEVEPQDLTVLRVREKL
jgi:uncharacterized protein